MATEGVHPAHQSPTVMVDEQDIEEASSSHPWTKPWTIFILLYLMDVINLIE